VPDACGQGLPRRGRLLLRLGLCLGEPVLDTPYLPHDADATFRRIHQFDERWNCALRMMENSFHNSHFSFVHKVDVRRRRAVEAGRSTT